MEKPRSFNRYSMLLVPLGILLNIGLAQLVLALELPLFLDSIGTILVAALGGYLPGIMVGFFSNVINGISDPITLYYSIISIMLAAAAAFLSRRAYFTQLWRSLLSVLVFSVIGGGLGSVLTWLLYGFSFGSGISAPFALLIHAQTQLSEFMSQFCADMLIDIADKLISVVTVFIVIKLLPKRVLGIMPLGSIYLHDPLQKSEIGSQRQNAHSYRVFSLKNKVVTMIVLTALVLGVFSTTISYIPYKDTMEERYVARCSSTVDLMRCVLDGDKINGYLESGVETEEYAAVKHQLSAIHGAMPDVLYMYVYQIREDGCHVVFDMDTSELAGGKLGSIVPYEEAFSPFLDDLLAGREIEPVISNGAYGWLLTVYMPLYDSNGVCTAYAAADIDMDNVIRDRYIFVIRVATLLFGVTIIIVAIAVWYAERKLVAPINAMAIASSEFAYDNENERLKSTDMIHQLHIHTGDEIENLYDALSKTVTDVADYINDINEKARIITQLQSNIIISFATMVENRDLNTGEHIKHTSAYVRVIAEELKNSSPYSERLSDEYIEDIVRSAPLHDIGKIKISDVILNKPGKLSPDEFDEIKSHTTAGRDILISMTKNIKNSDYLIHATEMAAGHHEKWDGSGYPDGLSGEDIPLSARIMAVADVLDALVSKRSYKEPMSFETAASIIVSESGTHFDPVVVKAFTQASGTLFSLIDG